MWNFVETQSFRRVSAKVLNQEITFLYFFFLSQKHNTQVHEKMWSQSK